MKDPNVKCLTCGIDFYKLPYDIKRRPNHFCSNKCKGTYHNKRVEVQCLNCQVLFFKQSCKVKLYSNHFCSNKCKGNYQIKEIKVQCLNCEIFFLKKLNKSKLYPNHFCSRKCIGNYRDKKVEVLCNNCNKPFMKKQHEIKRAPRHCCSIQCYRILAKYKKNWGSSRSKLEIYVEKRLKEELNLNILYNKNTIGYELDIHIPELNYAIEINGITHYKPIYGEDALRRRQEIDRLKAEECFKQKITLLVINVSNDKSNYRTLEKRYLNIKALILNRIKLYEYFSNQSVDLEL